MRVRLAACQQGRKLQLVSAVGPVFVLFLFGKDVARPGVA